MTIYRLFVVTQASHHFLMAKKEMSSFLICHQVMKTKANKSELELKSKDAKLNKKSTGYGKNGGNVEKKWRGTGRNKKEG